MFLPPSSPCTQRVLLKKNTRALFQLVQTKGPSQQSDRFPAPREIRTILISKSPLRVGFLLTSAEASKLKLCKDLNGIKFWPKQLLSAVLRALSAVGEPHLAGTGPFQFLHLSTHLVPYSPELYF